MRKEGDEMRKPDECQSCSYKTEDLKPYPRYGSDGGRVEDVWLCDLCAGSEAGSSMGHSMHFLAGVTAYVANQIIAAIKTAGLGGDGRVEAMVAAAILNQNVADHDALHPHCDAVPCELMEKLRAARFRPAQVRDTMERERVEAERKGRLAEHLLLCQEVTCTFQLPIEQSRCGRRRALEGKKGWLRS